MGGGFEPVVRELTARGLAGGPPEGLDTYVGEQGTRLSGGERQRLAVALAVLGVIVMPYLDDSLA